MTDLAEAIQSLPNQSWIPILVLVLLGVGLWLAGGRLLKSTFAVLGLAVGGGLGWLVGSTVDFGVPVWVISLIAGLLVACVATLAYRATVAMALAAVLALASPLGVWTAAGAELSPGPVGSTDDPFDDDPDDLGPVMGVDEPILQLDEIDLWLRDLAGDGATLLEEGPLADPQATFDLQQEVREQIEHARNFSQELLAHAQDLWLRTPPDIRNRLVGAAVVGGLIGFLLGTLATTISTWFVTAFAGALTLIVGGWSAATKAGVPEGPWLPETPNAWLTWWVIISVIGLLIQWMTRPKRADKPA